MDHRECSLDMLHLGSYLPTAVSAAGGSTGEATQSGAAGAWGFRQGGDFV